MYIDAYTGSLLSVAEIEPPQSEDDNTILQDIKNFKIHSNSSLEFEAKLKQNGFIKDMSSLEKLGDNINFTYSMFRKGELNYIHFQFKDMEERKLHEFFLYNKCRWCINIVSIYFL